MKVPKTKTIQNGCDIEQKCQTVTKNNKTRKPTRMKQNERDTSQCVELPMDATRKENVKQHKAKQ